MSAPSTVSEATSRMATDIPPSITTPDRVETRIGALDFTDGLPRIAGVRRRSGQR